MHKNTPNQTATHAIVQRLSKPKIHKLAHRHPCTNKWASKSERKHEKPEKQCCVNIYPLFLFKQSVSLHGSSSSQLLDFRIAQCLLHPANPGNDGSTQDDCWQGNWKWLMRADRCCHGLRPTACSLPWPEDYF